MAQLKRYVEPTGKNALFNGAYGYVAEGLYRGDGAAPAQMPGVIPGSLIIKDIHSYDAQNNLAGPDGLISGADQTLLGNLDPKFNFGIGNTFNYKGFDLTIFFSGVSQKAWSPYSPNKIYNIANLAASMGTYGWNTMPVSLTRWTFQNTQADFPTGLSDTKYSLYQNNSSYWLIDASFLRCRNITLGYAIPSSFFNNQKVFTGARISFDIQNPFTITSYPGLDPELNQNNYYPLVKSYVIGLNLNF